ncbi:YbaY family lipoprotein [Pseudomonas fluorescens]|uniref:YbaY family lipoprotein n=1 Tax=Pseudomonas fluorescens TaxID=294 RepID=UPI0002DBF441|nr:YbaY family lipoprotein [Pseudomonas fluorescens]
MKKIILLGLTALLGACQSVHHSPQASLDGEVFYLQRIALPAAATLSVSLQDVSLMDAPAVTLAEQKGPVKGQVPLPFHLSYDPAQVKPGHTYSVSARIELDGKLLFTTTGRHAVQLNGQDPQPLRLRVDAVAH